MQCWIAKDGTVAIDDAVFGGIDVSSLPLNVKIVFWRGDTPIGEVLYSDRVSVREKFTDLSPYLPILNDWIRAAANLLVNGTVKANPPLTLVQTQTIKNALVDALFVSKRQAAIVYLGQTYEGSDAEQNAMSHAISAAGQSSIDATNTALAGVKSTTDSALAGVKNAIDTALTALVGRFTGGSAPSGDTTINAGLFDVTSGGTWPNWAVHPPAQAAAQTVQAQTAAGPTIPWVSQNGSQNLSFAQMTALMKALTDRRAALQARQITHKTAIAALITPAAVASYDITTGW